MARVTLHKPFLHFKIEFYCIYASFNLNVQFVCFKMTVSYCAELFYRRFGEEDEDLLFGMAVGPITVIIDL
jgi:hypothetical protein